MSSNPGPEARARLDRLAALLARTVRDGRRLQSAGRLCDEMSRIELGSIEQQLHLLERHLFGPGVAMLAPGPNQGRPEAAMAFARDLRARSTATQAASRRLRKLTLRRRLIDGAGVCDG